MGLFTKFLAGGLGWVLAGGPIGAIVGVLIASLFDARFSGNDTEYSSQQPSNTMRSDFRIVLLVLLAGVMKADGRVNKPELDAAKRFLLNTFGEEQALEALQMLKTLLHQNIPVESVAAQVSQNINYSQRVQLLHMLYTVAYADGTATIQEKNVLYTIALQMGINRADIQSIEAMFTIQENPHWAYAVLEIEQSVSDEDVKQAYRRMAMKYHPDKVNTLGEEVKQAATEKFRKVNEAYESIKKQRDFK